MEDTYDLEIEHKRKGNLYAKDKIIFEQTTR